MQASLIDYMGDDDRVVDAARVSFEKIAENYTEKENAGLLRYLATHGHWTPFSHPQITFRYTVPIFVARQEFKHIVGFTRNEVSRRYVSDDPVFFIPQGWRSKPEGSVKQGSGDYLDMSTTLRVEDRYSRAVERCLDAYQGMLRDGVAPEQARMVLPQSMYTSYYVTGSLAAFARFYKQRTDPHAQVEIQELAKQVGDFIEPLYPVSWEALTK